MKNKKAFGVGRCCLKVVWLGVCAYKFGKGDVFERGRGGRRGRLGDLRWKDGEGNRLGGELPTYEETRRKLKRRRGTRMYCE